MRVGMTAAVLGASGYAGGELVRLVAGHPDLDLGPVGAFGNAGRTLGEVHPQLRTVADRPLVAIGPDDVADACAGVDVVFLALPHGESAKVAAALPPDQL